MKIIEPSIEVFTLINGDDILRHIEKCGRVCYKSEYKTTDTSAEKFVGSIIKRGHEAVIEHSTITVKFICDRGVSHEIVRHRIASFCQESTRYCNYCNEQFGNELTVIRPCFWEEGSDQMKEWESAMRMAESHYFGLINSGAKAQEARSVLPNSLKTEIVVTMNIREWRHFFKLRCAPAAHPQMRQVAKMALKEFKAKIPVLFDDINLEE